MQRVTICSNCGKDTDGLMTCIPIVGDQIRLCPDCLEKNGQYCFRCGHFNNNLLDGYCEECTDEIQSDDRGMDDEDADYWDVGSEFDDDDEFFDNEIN